MKVVDPHWPNASWYIYLFIILIYQFPSLGLKKNDSQSHTQLPNLKYQTQYKRCTLKIIFEVNFKS